MRIALVTSEYVTETNYDGGLANYIYKLAQSLKSFGNEVTVIVLSNHDEESEIEGINLIRVQLFLPKWIIVLNILTLQRFVKLFHLLRLSWLLNRKLCALHQGTPFAIVQYPQLGGLSFFHPRKIPMVVRLSSYTPIWRKKGGYDSESTFRIWQQELLEKWAMKRADAIFSPSQIMANTVISKLSRHVHVIENPYFQELTPWDSHLYQDELAGKTYFLFFGRLNVLKGVATIAEILNPLLKNHPDLFFVFAGNDPGKQHGLNMSEHLKHMAGTECERVLCLGKLPHKILYPIINEALAVVLPSLIDNFPNTCLEAMGLQKVVVGTIGTSFDQLIQDGKNGFLCRPDDPGHLLQTLEKVLTTTLSAREKIGRLAKERIEALKPDLMIPQLISLYQKVIANKAE